MTKEQFTKTVNSVAEAIEYADKEAQKLCEETGKIDEWQLLEWHENDKRVQKAIIRLEAANKLL